MLILGLKFEVHEIYNIWGLKFRTPKCAFCGWKFKVVEIIWGLIFLCPHKFISVQNFWWTADYLRSLKRLV